MEAPVNLHRYATVFCIAALCSTPASASSSGVMKGIQNGSLTAEEVFELVSLKVEVDTTERTLRSDGRMTAAEQTYLAQLHHDLDQQIARLSNNPLRRWAHDTFGW